MAGSQTGGRGGGAGGGSTQIVEDNRARQPGGTAPMTVSGGSGSGGLSLDPSRTRTRLREDLFDPTLNPAIMSRMDPSSNPAMINSAAMNVGLMNYGGRTREEATEGLLRGVDAPQIEVPDAYIPGTVRPDMVNPNVSHTTSGLAGANTAAETAADSRNRQGEILDLAMGAATGQGPSAAIGMIDENAARAARAFGSAGSQANQNYGQAQVGADLAFGDASAQQGYLTREAGIEAGRRMREGAERAVRGQAALASGARGGNIGLALSGAMNNAAIATQSGNIEASRAEQAAGRQASFNAAAAQRQAAANQAAGNLATQGTEERALVNAATAQEIANAEAAQTRAEDQRHGMDLAAGITGDMRGKDISTIGAMTDIGRLGLGLDTMITGTEAANADRGFAGDTFNEQMGLESARLNTGNALQAGGINTNAAVSTNAMNLGALGTVAGLGASDQQFGVGNITGDARLDAQIESAFGMAMNGNNVALGQLLAQVDEAQRQRILDEFAIRRGVAIQQRGQDIGLAGAGASALGMLGGAAIMASDIRAKKDIRKRAAPDFRKTSHNRYRYKRPDKHGAGEFEGPMAHELPTSVRRVAPDGTIMVDTGRLALQLASAVGDIQRRIES